MPNTAKSNCIFHSKLRPDRALIFRYSDSSMDKFFPQKYLPSEVFIYFNIALLQGVNWVQSWTKNANFEYVLRSQKFDFFEKRHVAVRYLWWLAVVKISAKSNLTYWSYCPKTLKIGPNWDWNLKKTTFGTEKVKTGKWWDPTLCIFWTPGILAPA